MDKEKDVCYVVEAHEGIEWVPKARYNFEDTKTFLVLAKNPFYRILKDGKDITSKYKQDSGKLQSNNNDSIVYDNSSSQIDSKLCSVYKYKGTVETSVLLPSSAENGDVYNVVSGSTTLKSDETSIGGILKSINIDNLNNTVSLTLSGVSIGNTNLLVDVGFAIKIPENYGGGTVALAGAYQSYSNNVLTLKKIDCDIASVFCFNSNFTMLRSMMGTSDTLNFDIDTIYFAHETSNNFNDGANVAWTGTTWDELGTTVDISAKADKSTTLAGYGITKVSNNATKPLKPAEYKAMSSECKQKLKADIQRMLDEKTKRNDIFHALNISESTYDIIRTEMKKDESVNKSDVIEPKLNKSARKGTLLGR